MAKKLGEFQYQLATSGANVTAAGVSTVTLAEGGQVAIQDSTVKLKSVSETVGACTVSGGNSSCTADKQQQFSIREQLLVLLSTIQDERNRTPCCT